MRATLKKARLKKKLTQEQVAEMVGIQRVYYLQIEAKQRNPALRVAFAIAEVLDADPRVLFADVMENNQAVAIS